MSSVSNVSSADASSPTSSAPGPKTGPNEPFSRMLAATLASFAGTGDPVRHHASQASRTWQTQKQLGCQFAVRKSTADLDAAAAAGRMQKNSRADHLRDQHEDRMKTRATHQDRYAAGHADPVAPSRDRTSRKQHTNEAASPSARDIRHEARATAERNVPQSREQPATLVQVQSSMTDVRSATSGPDSGVTIAGTQIGTATEEGRATTIKITTMQPGSAPFQAGAAGAQDTQQSSTGPHDAKAAASTAARVDSVQPLIKGSPSPAKSSGAPADFQDVLASAGGKKTETDGTKSSSRLSRAATPSLPRGINITESKAMQELAGIVRARINGRESSILLRLDPPELGKVQIDLNMKRDVLTLRMETQTQAGHDALQARLVELRHALEQHGITINRVEVELRPPLTPTHDANAPQHHHQQQQDAASQDQAYQQPASDGSTPSDDGHHAPGDAQSDRQHATEHGTGLEAGHTNDREYGDLTSLSETGVDLVV